MKKIIIYFTVVLSVYAQQNPPVVKDDVIGKNIVSSEAILGKLPKDKLAAILIIRGNKSEATGFISKRQGVLYIVTNIHVLEGNSKLSIQNINGVGFNYERDIAVACDQDVALLKLYVTGLESSEISKIPFLEFDADVLLMLTRVMKLLFQEIAWGGRRFCNHTGKLWH